MTMSFSLGNSIPGFNSSDYYTTYTRPATDEEIKQHAKGVAKDGFPDCFQFADKERTRVFLPNPVLTDVTQEAQTNIHTILAQNPDISGLSLILDDPAASDIKDRISIEDFLPPSQYVDVFDVQDFVDRAKYSFSLLPASLRKQFNNNPMELAASLERNDARALSALQQYLGVASSNDTKSVEQASVVKQNDVSSGQNEKDAPVNDVNDKSK